MPFLFDGSSPVPVPSTATEINFIIFFLIREVQILHFQVIKHVESLKLKKVIILNLI